MLVASETVMRRRVGRVEGRAGDDLPAADALIAAVAHRHYRALRIEELLGKLAPRGCLVDVKSQFDRTAVEAAGFRVWRL